MPRRRTDPLPYSNKHPIAGAQRRKDATMHTASGVQQRTAKQGYTMLHSATLLSTLQQKAIECLMQVGSVSQAAISAGTTRQTLHRWLKQKHFRAELLRLQGQALESAALLHSGLTHSALAAISTALNSKDESIALKAAGTYFAHASELLESAELNSRIVELESQAQAACITVIHAPEKRTAPCRVQTLHPDKPRQSVAALEEEAAPVIRRPAPDEPLVHPPKRNASCGIRIRALPKLHED